MKNCILKDYYFNLPESEFLKYQGLIPFFTREEIELFIATQQKRKKPLIVLVSGPSITGKSSISIEIAKVFGIRSIVSTDIVRLLIEKNDPLNAEIAKYRSFQCWQIVDDENYSDKKLTEGFQKQCQVLLKPIKDICENSIINVQNTIIEGVHLTPKLVKNLEKTQSAFIIPLFYNVPKQKLSDVMLRKRTRSTYMHRSIEGYSNRMKRFNAFIDWWKKEIEYEGFAYISNEGNQEDLLIETLREISLKIHSFI